MSGMDLLKASRSVSPETETILMTAYGTVENAVEAMKQGAYDFVTKPIKRAHVVRAVPQGAGEADAGAGEPLAARAAGAQRKKRLIGQSLTWRRTMEMVDAGGAVDGDGAAAGRVGHRQGAAGAGHPRGLAARRRGRSCRSTARRCPRPSSRPSCSATSGAPSPARSSATTAASSRPTRGTLFLDEIGEIPTHVQVKLLRVLQEGEVERLGGRTQKVDLRLVAATNQDLRAAVKEGRFREDLYYRLNVIALQLPPLRERRDDIPLLAEHFLRLYGERNGRHFSGFTRAALDALVRYDWPGNVRELENTIERAVVLARGRRHRGRGSAGRGAHRRLRAASDGKSVTFAIGTPLAEIERRVIHATLAHVGGDKRLCAQLLGIATRTIYRRLEEERGDEPGPDEPPDDDPDKPAESGPAN